jgi:hypothetical protein
MRFKELRQRLNESLKDEMSPAPMMVLRRRGIRIFPDGRRVALYTNDKYNLVFTIPFNGVTPQQNVIPGVQVGAK